MRIKLDNVRYVFLMPTRYAVMCRLMLLYMIYPFYRHDFVSLGNDILICA